jgi:shikimate dehydrogenase
VVGSGATALSACVALGSLGAHVTVVARNPAKAEALATRGAEVGVATDTTPWGVFPACDTVVSTVPASALEPHVPAILALRPSLVFDVVYHPWPTPLATAAAASGTPVLSGLDLLVHQAVAQFRLFTGREVAAEPLLLAVRAEAARRAMT